MNTFLGLEDFSVKIVGTSAEDLKFEITRVDGSVVVFTPDTKLYASQIVAAAYVVEDPE